MASPRPHLSMSGLERALACPASTVLPQARSTSAAAARGTVIHEYLARVPEKGRDAALELVPQEHREACASIDLSALPASRPDEWAAEVAFAYNPATDTARELGRGLERRYEGHVQAGEVPGTADVVGLTADAVAVVDYKTGYAELPPAGENWQLRGYALAAARAYGRERAVVAIVRIGEDGTPWWDRAELDALDLDATAAHLRGLLERAQEEAARVAAGEAPATTEGEHCRYCPAFASCPTKVRLAAALAAPEAWEQQLPTLTLENAPAVLARLEAAEVVLARVREGLEAFARQTPLPLPGGKVFGPVPHPREELDPARGVLVLSERFGKDVALASIETKQVLTKGKLEDAIRGWVKRTPGAKIGKALESALTALREAGAARTTYTYPVRVHKPKPAQLPAEAPAQEAPAA